MHRVYVSDTNIWIDFRFEGMGRLAPVVRLAPAWEAGISDGVLKVVERQHTSLTSAAQLLGGSTMSKTTQGWAAVALAAMTLPMAANAEGRFTGAFKPAGPYVSGGNNFYFRVQGLPTTANCSENWAYINEADSGAKGKIATMLMAYAQGRNVSLYVDTGDGGYCKIIELVVQ